MLGHVSWVHASVMEEEVVTIVNKVRTRCTCMVYLMLMHYVTAVDCIQRNTPSCDRNLVEAVCRDLNNSNMQLAVPQICMDLREVSVTEILLLPARSLHCHYGIAIMQAPLHTQMI